MTDQEARERVGEPGGGPMGAAYRLVTVSLLALVTIIAFESMAVGTAMPVVVRELDAVRAYGLAFSVMLTAQLLAITVAGVWTSRAGPLPALLTGQLLLAAGSFMAGVAPTVQVLLAGRMVAGLGGGLVVVAIYVVVGRAYPEAMRPPVFGWISAAWVLPSLVGPPVAGWLATDLSWRWVFLLVVPPVAVTATVVWVRRGQLAGPPSDTAPVAGGQRLVALGLLVALGAGALQWGGQELSPVRALAVLVGLVGLAAIVAGFPKLVPPGTLRLAHGLPAVIGSRFLLTSAFFGANTFVPLMLVGSRGLTPTVAGAMSTVGALGWSAGSWWQGRPGSSAGRARLISLGGALLALSCLLLAAVAGFGWPSWVVAVASGIGGLGMGTAMSSVSVLSLALSPVAEHGRTSSSLQLSDVLGSVLGIAAAGTLFAARHDGIRSDEPTYLAIWLAFAAVAAVVVLAGQRSRT